MSIFLGIDVGTSGTKTLAIDESGSVLAEANQSYPCYQPYQTWSEQDPEDWWNAAVATVRRVLLVAGLKPSDVVAIGLSGQMHGAVFLDSSNQSIRPAILWNDQRTTLECDEIEAAAGGRKALISMVGSPALTGFTAPKMLWLRKHEPHNWQRVSRVLLPKDEIRRRLTGEFATDVSDASGTLLFDVQARTWSKELLALLNLDVQLLPRCYESPEITGKLTAAAAEQLGLTTDCVVVAGAGDCPAGAIGNGIVKRGIASTLIGTSSVFLVHSDQCEFDPDGRLHTFCHAVPGKWFMMGVNLSGGGCMQWFRNQLCASEMKHAASEDDVYNILMAEAEAVPPGADELIFLPYLSGERHPHNDAIARGCFIGLTLSHTRGHMVRAIMEGVTYNMRESMSLIERLNIPISEVRPSGGGSKSVLWRQIQRNVFEKNVARVKCSQGPAFGVAILAAVGVGAFKTVEEACSATIDTEIESLQLNEAAEYYQRAFPIFQSMYGKLRYSFQHLAALRKQEQPEQKSLAVETR